VSTSTPARGDAEGWRAFTASVVALVGDRDPLAVQGELLPGIRAALAGVPPAALRTPEAPGKWSIAAVLEHLADAELVFGYRLRQVLTLEAPRLESFDQDAWAARGRYDAGDPEESIAALGLLRARNLRLWHRLSAADWERVGIHGDRGRESLRDLARIVAGHDLFHRRQVARIAAASVSFHDRHT
jgi:hypothetical protein